MKGTRQLSEGDTVKTLVGTGYPEATKVKAEILGIHDDQVSYEVLEVVDEGDVDVEEGEQYASSTPDSFYWETV